MRLLILTPRFPHPLDKGDKLRAYHQIAELAKRHEVTLCALTDQPVPRSSVRALEGLCRRVVVFEFSRWRGWLRAGFEIFGSRPLQVGYFDDHRIAPRVRAVIAAEAPDLVLCQLVRSAGYVVDLELPKALDLMDAFSWGMEQRSQLRPGWFGPLFALESRRLRRYEASMIDRFDRCTIITSADRDHLDHPSRHQVAVVGNGVDLQYFQPRAAPVDIDLLFVGNMSYPPNADAAEVLVREVLPRVRACVPAARVLIAGTSPSPAVRRLAGDGVEVSGWVDDISACYARSRLFVSPMRFGTGLQNKILQAMAMGIPCVTTPIGERDLDLAPHGLRVADTADEIAATCVELLNDADEARRLGLEGRRFVVEHCSWAGVVADLEAVLVGVRGPVDRPVVGQLIPSMVSSSGRQSRHERR